MNNLVHVFRFILLVALQVIILNNIQFMGYINPYLYIYFILLLPFETPKWLLLILSFALGLAIDIFSVSIGIHAFACVFAAFCRPMVINMLISGRETELKIAPSIRDMGFRWFITYTLFIVFIHHFLIFFLELYRIDELFNVFLRMLMSTSFTIILVISVQYLFYRNK